MNIPRFVRRLFRAPYDGMRHFRAVEEGVLYRCGQLTPEQLRQVIQRYGLRTVISLRGARAAGSRDSWEAAERGVCADQGAEFVSLPCNHRVPPSPEQVEQFLSIMGSDQRRPVLVHCRIGQQRTGLFCALFRVRIQGLEPALALHEMDDLGFGSGKRRHRRLLETFHQYARSSATAVLPA